MNCHVLYNYTLTVYKKYFVKVKTEKKVVVVVRKAIDSESKTGLRLKVYPCSTPGCCPAKTDVGSIEFRHQEPSDHALHVLPNAGCAARC